MSVTLVHLAKAIGRNEMPFGRDTRVVPSNTVLDRGPDPPWKGEIWGSQPHFAVTPPIAKLLWPSFYNTTTADSNTFISKLAAADSKQLNILI